MKQLGNSPTSARTLSVAAATGHGGASHSADRPARPVVELAGVRRRLASLLYECLLLLGVLALTFMVPWLILGVGWQIAPPGWLGWIHVSGVLGAYFVWYWRKGQTLAMQTWRLMLVEAGSGGPVGTGRAWLRYFLAWPSVLFFGVGLAWALVDPDRQFLHDRLAGTRVVLLASARR